MSIKEKLKLLNNKGKLLFIIGFVKVYLYETKETTDVSIIIRKYHPLNILLCAYDELFHLYRVIKNEIQNK